MTSICSLLTWITKGVPAGGSMQFSVPGVTLIVVEVSSVTASARVPPTAPPLSTKVFSPAPPTTVFGCCWSG